MGDQGFVSAGYLVVRRVARPRYLDSTFPAQIVSASDHIAPVIPVVPTGWIEALDAPPSRFSGYADAAQGNLLWALEADLERFGLDGSLAADMSDFLAAARARGDFHPPSSFASLESARRFLRFFGPFPEDTLLLGLALRPVDVDGLSAADDALSAYSRLPPCGDPPADEGDVLGFDVYDVEDGDLRPWIRLPGSLERLHEAGLQPNGAGLFASFEDAVGAADVLRAEGGAWRAWRLAGYALTGS